jgi:sugar/nucleoside kinase (ribokinase family)
VARAPLRALVVGAITRDLELADDAAGRARPGGVVFHAGSALARLGARTRVVTRLRPADARALLSPLRAEGIEVLALPSRRTTTYANDYSGAVDRHEIRATSDPIRPADLPEGWREADLVQLGPLHRRDIVPETAAVLRGFRGIDVQGLVRVRGPGGTRLRPFAALSRFLAHVDVVQASEPELRAMLGGGSLRHFVSRHGVREMIVTRGMRGATVVTRDGACDVAGYAARGGARVGAGDVFLAAYLLLRVRGLAPVAAADGAARICALKIARGMVPKNLRLARYG